MTMSKSKRYCNDHILQSAYISFASLILLLHLLLVSCHAVVFHIPLKQLYRNTAPVPVKTTFLRSDSDSVRIHRREATLSNNKLDFDSMKNNLRGVSGDGYYVDVNIGSPPQKLQVLIDTGSANFAVACGPSENIDVFFHRENSSTYEDDGTEIYVPYTEGEWTGSLGVDMVSLTSASNLSTEANIACITSSQNFYEQGTDWVGILGLAYSELARPDSSITPFFDSLFEAYPDLEDVFSIQLCGSSFVHTKETPLLSGSLILGGSLPDLAKSEFFYTPLYKEWYYEVIITDIQVQGESLGLDCKEYNMDKTIVDSGTTTIRLPVKIFEAVTNLIAEAFENSDELRLSDASFFSGQDSLCVNDMSVPFRILPIVSFFLMETDNSSFRLDLTPQHYLRPVTTASIGGEVTQSCVQYGFASSNTGTVLGAVLMEAFYVVFDRANSRLGFAQTSCPLPDPTNKILNVTIQGPFESNIDLSKCAFKKADSGETTFQTASYVLLAISLVICIPLILLCVFRVRKFCYNRWQRRFDDNVSERQTVFSTSEGD